MTYPNQPGPDNQPTQPTYFGPPQPPKPGLGRKLGIGCAGFFGLILLIAIVSALAGGGDGDNTNSSADAIVTEDTSDTLADDPTDEETDPLTDVPTDPTEEPKPDPVVFKVWGSAPNGVDITYGSDSDNLDAHGLPVKKTLKFSEDAMYYVVTAQLQGGGDIKCSVTVNGQTKTGHARGDYNICHAQLSYTGLGWD